MVSGADVSRTNRTPLQGNGGAPTQFFRGGFRGRVVWWLMAQRYFALRRRLYHPLTWAAETATEYNQVDGGPCG